jgi:uncharacterized protein
MDELFNSFSSFLKNKFPGQKILKIPINGGFSCPNRDGLFSKEGCIFCDPFAAGPIRNVHMSIEQQIEKYMATHPGRTYIAYFQSHSNTYGPISELRRKYEIVFKYKNIIGLFIGTRPDMISDHVFLFLKELKQRIYLTVELGLQSIHAQSLLLLKRNHTYQQFLETYQKLQALKIDTIVHLIIGIPGETREHMLATVEEMNRLKPQGIKFHLLHILKDTTLFKQYLKTPFPLLSQDEYTDLVIFLLEHLDPDIVIHRLTAEREREIFYAPEWALHKQIVLNSIKSKMKKADSVQGRRFFSPKAV